MSVSRMKVDLLCAAVTHQSMHYWLSVCCNWNWESEMDAMRRLAGLLVMLAVYYNSCVMHTVSCILLQTLHQ